MLSSFDFYTSIGWQIVPLRPLTKLPLLKGWNKGYNPTLIRPYFHNEQYNMGLLLGKIIDIEADSDKANDLLNSLLDGVKHPVYSSTKSTHHLFMSPDRKLTRRIINGIEFRGHKHQSVLPPSTVGITKYTWLDTAGYSIPELPKSLLSMYNKHVYGVNDCWIVSKCNICNKRVKIHHKRLSLEISAFRQMNQKWMCHKCRKIDIRNLCRKIRKQLLFNINERY